MHRARRWSIPVLTAASILLGATGARAQAPYLVKDVNPVPLSLPGLEPTFLSAGVDTLYFLGRDQTNGRELWRTGGTPQSTALVRDILPGPFGGSSGMTTVGNTAFFASLTVPTGEELWRSDGTADGTRLVKDIRPGTNGSSPEQLTSAGGLLFMSANSGALPALWRSDGTESGTIPLLGGFVNLLLPGDGPLFFVVGQPASGLELWKSDGTPGGTVLVKDICAGACDADPRHLTRVGGLVYFTADDGQHGRELWVTDGTAANTALVTDLVAGPGQPGITELAAVGSTLFFAASSPQHTLWRSDGTAAGTQALAVVEAEQLAAGAGRLFFVAGQWNTGRSLWQSDGTPAGTSPITLICAPCQITDIGLRLVGSAQLMFFTRGDGELGRSDGTVSGTFDLAAGAVAGSLTVWNDRLYFSKHDIVIGQELWRSDGTPAGTFPLRDLIENSSDPQRLVVAQDRLFFQAYRADLGQELWVTEGTEATTVGLDLAPGPQSYVMDSPGALGRDLLFNVSGGPGITTHQLWKSDGTLGGTSSLRSLRHGPPAQLGSIALLGASEDAFEWELWKTDGTASGTALVKDINPGTGSSFPQFLSALAGQEFFSAIGSKTWDLWRTDATSEGTTHVGAVQGHEAAPLGGALILSAHEFVAGRELWRSDGWPQGTSLVKDILPGFDSSSPESLTAANGQVFFAATTYASGRELWKTDGTETGTTMVADILPGTGGALDHPMVEMGGIVYFLAHDGVHGLELWRSDGSAAGTFLVKDTMPGPESGFLVFVGERPLTTAGGRLWFRAYSPASGFEPWQSDGTEAGTIQVADVATGPWSSFPEGLQADGQRLYFVAEDGVRGRELWALELPPTLSVDDAHAVEGDGGAAVSFSVRLSRPATRNVTVSYSTANGTAMAGTDYVAQAGTLTFPTGPLQAATVSVPIVGDPHDEEDEAFTLRLGAPMQAGIADGEGTAVIRDDDAPRVAVHDVSVPEGDAGTSPAAFELEMITKDGLPTSFAKTLDFRTAPFTAAAGFDYTEIAGALTFAAGTPNGGLLPVTVDVLGDTVDEVDERFLLRVTPASDLVPADGEGSGWILDDDGGVTGLPVELLPGSRFRRALNDPTGAHRFVVSQQPFSSYEIVVDEVSGDAQPLVLERVTAGGQSVLQVAQATGTGASVSMRWRNDDDEPVTSQEFSLRSGGCNVDCGADDTYRARMYDTTLSGTRYNNDGSLRTFLILQNRSAHFAEISVAYWSPHGGAPFRSGQHSLASGQSVVLSSPLLSHQLSGSVTVGHTAGYGGLSGKLVTLDPATGFSFDTPLTYRPR